MNENETSELEANIETTIAAAHAVFDSQKENSICEILVNSQPSVDFFETRYDFGDPVQYFIVTLTISSDMFYHVAPLIETVGETISRVLNQVHQTADEYVSRVRIKIDPQSISDWRKRSGLLIDGQMNYTDTEADALWGTALRIFISHSSEQKEWASKLGEFLKRHGMSVFVAHEDIHPTLEWQREIEKALNTMDAFVAILTEDFKSSDWCSQELGFAVARAVPIFPVRLGKDPYGFIGKFQALSSNKRVVNNEIEDQFSDHPRMPSTKLAKCEIFIEDVDKSNNFRESIRLSRRLSSFESMTVELGDKLAEAVNGNVEARGSWGFNSKREENGYLNIAEHLTRLTGKDYELNEDKTERHKWLVRRVTKAISEVSSGEVDDDDDLEDLPW